MQDDEIDNATTDRKKGDFLTALFTGWGVPGGLARIIAGAILGALSALWALSQTGCTAEWTQYPDGSSSWYGKVELAQPGNVIPADK